MPLVSAATSCASTVDCVTMTSTLASDYIANQQVGIGDVAVAIAPDEMDMLAFEVLAIIEGGAFVVADEAVRLQHIEDGAFGQVVERRRGISQDRYAGYVTIRQRGWRDDETKRDASLVTVS